MERLTQKREDGFYELKDSQEIYGKEAISRLAQVIGKYEDIEESAGMPLERLIAILKDGFWVVATEDDSQDVFQVWNTRDVIFDFDAKEITVYFEFSEDVYNTYKFEDCGNTWALTKEGLE